MARPNNQRLLILAIAVLSISVVICIASFVAKNSSHRAAGYDYTRLFETAQTESLTEVVTGKIQSINHSVSGGEVELTLTLINSSGELSIVVLSDFENSYNSIATRFCKLDFCSSYGTIDFEDSAWSSAAISEIKPGDELVLVKQRLTGANEVNIYQLYISR